MQLKIDKICQFSNLIKKLPLKPVVSIWVSLTKNVVDCQKINIDPEILPCGFCD